jgi:polysaccharide biosynthesis/export protein
LLPESAQAMLKAGLLKANQFRMDMARFLSRSGRMKAAFYAPLALAALLIGGASVSHAQQLPAGTDQLLQYGQSLGLSPGLGVPGQGGLNGSVGGAATNLPQSTTLQPVVPGSQPPLPPSRLEQIMSVRAGARLQQFGYEQLGRGATVQVPQTGAVQDDYVLGPGDELFVSLRGQENSEFRVEVDRNGQVVVPRLNPVPATGRTFGDFRRDLEDAVRRSYVGTQVSVAVGRTRQISVLVSGEVNSPGQRLLTGLSSAVDALLLSGGVKKTGSLRNVRIERNGHQFTVDLYSVLTTGAAPASMRLTDGDRILVPPLGKTVAISGLVRQPGIYELPAGASSTTSRALLDLAGGLEVRGQYRLSVLRIMPNGSTQMTPLVNESGTIGDSEILFVQLGADQTVNQATLSGESPLAGQYPITTGTKLSDVLKAPGALPPEPYTLFGIIARKDPHTLLRTLVAFTPVAILNGSEDEVLENGDIIRVLSFDEVRLLTNTVRLYNERQALEQAEISNPLSGPQQNGNQQFDQSSQTALNNQTNGSAQSQQNGNQAQQQYLVTTDLAEMQRRDIAELADIIDPMTYQANIAAAQAQRQQESEQQQANIQNNPQLQFQNEQLQLQRQQMQLQQAQPPSPSGQNSNVQTAGQGGRISMPSEDRMYSSDQAIGTSDLTAPPALNFESVDAACRPESHSTGRSAISATSPASLTVDQLVLVNFLIDHQVDLSGAVSGPGHYFRRAQCRACRTLVSAAGGTTNWADESGVELITTAVDKPVRPIGDPQNTIAPAPGHARQLCGASQRRVPLQRGLHGCQHRRRHGRRRGALHGHLPDHARRAPVRPSDPRRRTNQHRLSLWHGVLAQVRSRGRTRTAMSAPPARSRKNWSWP